MNKVILVGRLTKDPHKFQNDKMSIVGFTIAITNRYKKDKTDFIPCKAFGKVADLILQYCKKGKQVSIAGAISTNSTKNQDGTFKFTMEVTIQEINFLGKKEDEESNHDVQDINWGDK